MSVPLCGFSESPKDNDIRIENERLGAGMRIIGDRPLSSESLWSTPARSSPGRAATATTICRRARNNFGGLAVSVLKALVGRVRGPSTQNGRCRGYEPHLSFPALLANRARPDAGPKCPDVRRLDRKSLGAQWWGEGAPAHVRSLR